LYIAIRGSGIKANVRYFDLSSVWDGLHFAEFPVTMDESIKAYGAVGGPKSGN
jgi:hypothetical protein